MTTEPPPPVPQARMHAEFANFHEAYVRHYISLADTKAAWTFAIASGLVAYIFSKDERRAAFLTPDWSATYLMLVAAVALLTASALFSFSVVAPRLRSPSGEGVVFFGAVARKTDASAYLSEVLGLDEAAVLEARLRHCYDVSRVCADKYGTLKKAMWCGLPGIVLGLVYLLIR